MEQTKTITFKDFVTLVRRRRWALILPALAVFLLSVVVIMIWEPVYRSTSTILIEEQEIPREYVMATVTSYAEQRLQSINQRIMSSSRLLEIINRFNLYADKRNRFTTEEIVENMRKKDIKFSTITADIVDPRSGVVKPATIAFSLSYEGKNPLIVQQVDNVLASLYLEENIRVVDLQTTSTSKFLEDEMKDVQGELVELEKKIAVYKEKNPRSLPELLQYNLQTLDWTDRNYEQFNDQLRTLKEKEGYLKSQLASMLPQAELLKELRAKLISLKSKYSDEYPDVKKTKVEIAELEKKSNSEEAQTNITKKQDNPAYVALDAQLASTQSEISSVKRQIEDAKKKKTDYSQRLEMSPRVEEGYKNLLVERNNTQLKYDDLMKKFMEARVAHGLEKGQMGERFTLIDPARLPEKPVIPNRPAILLIGLFLGIGAGVGTASLQEVADKSARSSEDLATKFPFPVLAEIPEIITLQDERRKKKSLKTIAGVVILTLVIVVLIFHFFVMDLDVLWARLTRYLAL
jgi:polysaccharide chain length determinant protein (PEP-CTERM system associated)